ncbi:MAG: hypothetical protein LRY27_02565 [Chitinophagales bacterium]|nr:hypothetical protein [Chitinophagales bacterium]
MNKILSVLLLICICFFTQAQNKVLFFNQAFSEEAAKEFAKENNCEFYTFIQEKNALIIETSNEVENENILFQAVFKTKENMFCF